MTPAIRPGAAENIGVCQNGIGKRTTDGGAPWPWDRNFSHEWERGRKIRRLRTGCHLRCIHVRCRYSVLQFLVRTCAAQRLKITISRLKIDAARPHERSYASTIDSASEQLEHIALAEWPTHRRYLHASHSTVRQSNCLRRCRR
jgi:hypothetical protein